MNEFLRRGVSAFLAAGVIGAAIWAPLSTAQNEDTYKSLKLFGDVFDTVRANYVEEVDDEALIRAAIQGMLQSLDPHSGYEPPEAYEETRRPPEALPSRLALCRLTADTLRLGLGLLGIATLDRM